MSRPPQDDAAAQRQLAGFYRDVFEVDRRGQAIYEDLYRRFAGKAKVHTSGGIDAVLRTYQDAAHREVIEHIVRMVNLANSSDDSQPLEDDHG